MVIICRRQRAFRIVIKLAARVDLHHLEMFLAGRQADAPQEALQVLDIVLRELPTARYLPVGRSFYSPDLGRRQQLGEGLESWRDMSSTAFIEPLPVIDFVTQLLNRDVQSRPLSDADRVKIKKALRGVKVEVTHRGNMRRKYRISGLTSQATRELTYSKRLNERQITALLKVTCQRPHDRELDIIELKYHDTGREKDCLPRVGQWNMMNKVLY
ncbi:hypothetical protein B296_00054497 [Ensete ventricosum]|uniref:PAZ domain-containing protein n=1 Tax=Ensete ventricosum TaxID=4639 RepID=A0A426Y3Q3_ENSVE|nr:hypothetical protein B296_00054497 [Ensete ventricosum]